VPGYPICFEPISAGYLLRSHGFLPAKTSPPPPPPPPLRAPNPRHGVLDTLRLLLRPPPPSPPRAPPAAGALQPPLPRSSFLQAPLRRRPTPPAPAPAPHGFGPRRRRLFRRVRCAPSRPHSRSLRMMFPRPDSYMLVCTVFSRILGSAR